MTITPEVLKTLKSESFAKVTMGKKRTHSFLVEYSEVNPEFVGKFIVHHPTQLERMQIGVIKSSLLGGMATDVVADNLAHIFATFEVVLDYRPDWFHIDNDEITYEMLLAIYEEYSNWLDSFRKPIKPDNNTGDSEGGQVEVSVVANENISDATNGQ